MAERTAVVTGASRGLGLATARRFVELGYSTFIGARDREALTDREREFASLEGDGSALRTDVQDEFDLERLMEHAGRIGGGIDVIVANATIRHRASAGSSISGESYAAFDDHVRTNTMGVCATIKESLPHLSSTGLILVVSCDGSRSEIGGSYTVSKAAAEAIATEFAADFDPTVGTVYPGPIHRDPDAQDETRDVVTAADRLVRLSTEADRAAIDGSSISLWETRLLD